jgi:hypothetical protein
LLDLSSGFAPVRSATVAHIELLVVPPELEAAERSILIAPQGENAAGIEQLFYLGLVFYNDLFHCAVLPEKLSAIAAIVISLH